MVSTGCIVYAIIFGFQRLVTAVNHNSRHTYGTERLIFRMVRMLKQKVLAGAEGHSHDREIASREAHHSENSIAKQLVFMLVWALVGLFMPRASVYGGMAPFGVSFAAAVPGAGALWCTYLQWRVSAARRAVVPLRYAAALAAVAGIKWSLSGIKSAARHPCSHR